MSFPPTLRFILPDFLMPRLPPPSLFIASLGNPGPSYALTRHSAGHVVLISLATHLDTSPTFSQDASGAPKASGQTTFPPEPLRPSKKRKRKTTPLPGAEGDGTETPEQASSPAPPSPPPSPPPPAVAQWTLWQSPSYMNVSGPSLRQAWRTHRAQHPSPADTRLVILHDSLEHGAGEIAVRAKAGSLSAKGHNGIKSVLEAFEAERTRGARKAKKVGGGGGGGGGQAVADDDGPEWTKISIGIGRPKSRDPEDVSSFVLGKFRPHELDVLRQGVTSAVVKALQEIR